ncbi:MAG: deoxyuridine 5'-triphosphate nucleotidohydrolase [Chloroflexota bacterium]
MSILTKSEIEKLIKATPPLVQGYLDLKTQLQPNGIDLTLKEIARFKTAGKLTVDNSQRVISELELLPFDKDGFIDLKPFRENLQGEPGAYLVTFNETVNLPDDLTALGQPRSSLLRCGVNIGTAVWDAGYSGRSQSLLTVHNPLGFRLERNARILQLIFFRLGGRTAGYKGRYQGENT